MTCEELLAKYSLPNAGHVGAGWLPLVEELIVELKGLGWDGDLGQIKEKFGGLRFYVGAASDEMHDLITQAELKSFRTCEQCGAPGELRTGGWVKTLCDRHATKRT